MGSSPLGSKEQEEFRAQSYVIFECDGHEPDWETVTQL